MKSFPVSLALPLAKRVHPDEGIRPFRHGLLPDKPAVIEGRFSPAGAQTKDALYQKDGAWLVPGGRTPSTHILKPELDEFDHHALNEHFCLQLAAKSGLMRTASRIMDIGVDQVFGAAERDEAYGGHGEK